MSGAGTKNNELHFFSKQAYVHIKDNGEIDQKKELDKKTRQTQV
jgi:hypothetical protein